MSIPLDWTICIVDAVDSDHGTQNLVGIVLPSIHEWIKDLTFESIEVLYDETWRYMDFYTNVIVFGNSVLVRGIQNGERVHTKGQVQTYLIRPCQETNSIQIS